MTTPSASVLARRRNARAALDLARAEHRVISNIVLDDQGRDARDWLVAQGWTLRAAVSAGLVLLAKIRKMQDGRTDVMDDTA